MKAKEFEAISNEVIGAYIKEKVLFLMKDGRGTSDYNLPNSIDDQWDLGYIVDPGGNTAIGIDEMLENLLELKQE